MATMKTNPNTPKNLYPDPVAAQPSSHPVAQPSGYPVAQPAGQYSDLPVTCR